MPGGTDENAPAIADLASKEKKPLLAIFNSGKSAAFASQ
jgi:hypothetical protein